MSTGSTRIEGVLYSLYGATQKQRQFKNNIRKLKKNISILENNK